MQSHQTVVAPSWWSLRGPAAMRLVHLALMGQSDRDGIVRLDSNALAESCDIARRQVVVHVQDLEKRGYLITYTTSSGMYAWVPLVAETQPTRGTLKRARDLSLPAPPRETIKAFLAQVWGKEPTAKECKRACPRAWGAVSAAAGTSVPDDSVQAVFDCWKARQEKPGACKLGAATQKMIRAALQESSVEQLIDLIVYAYEADEPGPRFWRGENSHNRTYLGLDNLMVASKLQGRLQLVAVWKDKNGHTEDGTNLGPLAAYRRGPRGTKSTPDPRPKRLSDQCVKILALFRERGPEGVRTSELAAIALKYTGRLSEIRGAGHDIVLVEREKSGNNLYVLNEESGTSEELD